MSQEIDREGTFRGRIVSYGLQEAQSKALAVQITARIDEQWVDDHWEDWRQYDVEASGYIWIIKKDGSDNDSQVRALVDCAGWDGVFSSIVSGAWKPEPCQFVVKEDSYKEQIRYRINWLNAYDSSPTGGNVDSNRARELDALYGSRIRAVVGNVKRNALAPSGKPSAPPPPANRGMTREEVAAESAAIAAGDGGEIPF